MNKEKNYAAYIKLGLWLIFIITLVLIVKLGGHVEENNKESLNKEEEKEELITYQDKLNNLKDNFAYNYEIKVGDMIITYQGEKNGLKESGVRKIPNEELHYYKDNGYNYAVIDGGLNQISDLYNNIDENLLNIDYLKNILNNNEYSVDNYIYTYNLEDKEIIVYTNETSILQIEININTDYYKLNFNNLNEIKEITY